ncbi:MAG: hypothetical protein ACLFMM_01175 [Methanohalobium sp.]|uniref:hypothetical protein n=1 Tax=Methanohalobium sp. TaxID=2837493 RepID=UPI00397BEC07
MFVLTVALATTFVSLVFGFTDPQYQFLESENGGVYISDFELGEGNETNGE